ncbi:hypothetical protein [Salipiger mucosus]|uniref:Uncharacterized protein n=1 Tax=Salipiger mucosus DSM 16094 TaxID=1123237 RepID=S9SCB2_9RHOB|nr:hypothetical protein [Salipiger mucosus]EPX83879.1 hypothetical protein Salmuc_01654 [Salipiger mucosus DSM 16094]
MPTRFEPEPVSSEEVRDYRDRTGAGLHEARRKLSRRNAKEPFRKLREEGTVEEKVEWLLDRFEEKHFPEMTFRKSWLSEQKP